METCPLDRFAPLTPWLETLLGAPLRQAAWPPPLVAAPPRQSDDRPFFAVRLPTGALVTAHADWHAALAPILDGLTPDELFSVFGAYELARAGLPHGYGIWGPSWYYVADAKSFTPVPTQDVVELDPEALAAQVDPKIFWHCFGNQAHKGFGLFAGEELTALAAVLPRGGDVWEIGIDVAPGHAGKGLGRQVFSAAGHWILDHGGLILATTAPWNVPSARLLRASGLRYVLCDLTSQPLPFRVPPQPLGRPLPDTPLHDLYPEWAKNKDIRPRQDLS